MCPVKLLFKITNFECKSLFQVFTMEFKCPWTTEFNDFDDFESYRFNARFFLRIDPWPF